jgi:hypothetical protein
MSCDFLFIDFGEVDWADWVDGTSRLRTSSDLIDVVHPCGKVWISRWMCATRSCSGQDSVGLFHTFYFFFGFNIGKNKLGWYGHKVSWFQAWSSSQAKGSYIMGLGDFNTCWLSDESLQGWQNARWWHVRYHSRIWISCDLHPRRRKLESSGGNTFLSNPGTVSSKKLQKKWVCLTKKKRSTTKLKTDVEKDKDPVEERRSLIKTRSGNGKRSRVRPAFCSDQITFLAQIAILNGAGFFLSASSNK